MGGRVKAQPVRDASGKYRKQCNEIAADFGWTREAVWFWFDQIACVREAHLPQFNRAVHEDMAYRDLVSVFDKRGCAPS